MARRRMFSLDVVDTDAFLDLPSSSQALYFHLGMRADDDGFVSSPKRITATVSASPDDLKLLITKGFVIPFDSGVCVIRDWKKNNYIQSDRRTDTAFVAEKALLQISEDRAYQLLDTACIHLVSELDTQISLDKTSSDKENKADKPPRSRFVPPTLEEVRAYCRSRNSPVDPVKFYDYFTVGHWKDSNGKPVKSWKQKLLTWEDCEKQRGAQQPSPSLVDLSWRQTRSFAAENPIEDPPGSGQYRLREEVRTNE